MSSEILDVLPVSLDLVRVPRARVSALVRPILAQLLAPEPTFLALTANEIELTIFAADAAAAFAPVVRRDRCRHAHPGWEAVEVSAEKWKVIQIPSPDDSGACLHEISAPIAAAGISILYHSSLRDDYILVKESRLRDVLLLLASVGFTPLDGYPPDLDPSSPEGSSAGPASGACLARNRSASVSPPRVSPPPRPYAPAPADIRILTPELTSVGLPLDDADAWLTKLMKLVAFPETIGPTPEGLALELELDSPFAEPDGAAESSGDESAGTDVSFDAPAPASAPVPAPAPRKPRPPLVAPFFSFTRAPEGASLTTGTALLAALFPPHARPPCYAGTTHRCLQVDLRRCALDAHGLVYRFAGTLAEHAIEHVYSSTFKTANILVNEKDALRARALLALC